jgi:Iap family predicted aminopeptidase
MEIVIGKTERNGHNIAALIDNGAKYTVIVGAHYDHLGYGEDGNSLFANAVKEHQIHHGADDNASGTAAVLQVAAWVKNNHKKTKNFNYLFLNFSGEELGLFGSKAFVKEHKIDSTQYAYMINMDMVGRLNDSTHALELGGVGTSPAWSDLATMAGKEFKIVIDSSGQGPSDHTSFYNAGLPVLFMFTLQHHDYHKPTDIAERINYTGEAQIIKYVEQIIAKEDKANVKPVFTQTKQKSPGATPFKVTLGIMPDYSYQEGGVRIDGVSDNRPAAKAGLKQGDVIIKLGPIEVKSMQSYMEALGKFKPGDKTEVIFMRNGKQMTLPIELMGK